MPETVPVGVTVRKGRSLTSKIQFDLVYAGGKSWAGREIVIRALPNGLGLLRFGFVVSRRVGKAVVRNRVRRRLREIVRKIPVQPGWDIILIARIPVVASDFVSLSQSVRKLLVRAGLSIEENEGFSPGIN